MNPIEEERRRVLATAFRMPTVQTMLARKSSITNAFVNAVIPVIPPTAKQIEHALTILAMEPDDVRCAYCGDKSTEWDHLRPLVLNRRPTGFISEIGNLVPSCGKCNQSKGNKHWEAWMLSKAPRSPKGRGISDVADRVVRLKAYESEFQPTKVEFVSIIGHEPWEQYWSLCEKIIEEMRLSQIVANGLRSKVNDSLREA